ncbi:MAG: hypothetical protein ACTS6G_05240 [Candidatus Hodgkinia cicadicola]
MARRGHSAVVGRRGGRKWTKVVVETCNTAGECTLERVERVVEEKWITMCNPLKALSHTGNRYNCFDESAKWTLGRLTFER